MQRRHWIIIASLCVACGPGVSLDESGSGGSASTAASTTSNSATGTSVSGSTAADSTGAGPVTTTGLDGGTATTTTGEPESVCDPQPQEVFAGITVDDGHPPEEPPLNPYVYVDCMIDDFTGVGAGGDDMYSLELTCADGPHEVRFRSSILPARPSSGPLELTVHWSYSSFGGEDVLVVLRYEGQVQLAGGFGPLLPGDGEVPPDFTSPLSVELLTGVCGIEPEEEHESGFIDSSCFLTERQALRFSLDGASADVYDHGRGEVGPLWVVVQHAEQRHEFTCTDIPGHWYQWVATYPYLE